jgi:hypothetical protein
MKLSLYNKLVIFRPFFWMMISYIIVYACVCMCVCVCVCVCLYVGGWVHVYVFINVNLTSKNILLNLFFIHRVCTKHVYILQYSLWIVIASIVRSQAWLQFREREAGRSAVSVRAPFICQDLHTASVTLVPYSSVTPHYYTKRHEFITDLIFGSEEYFVTLNSFFFLNYDHL